MAHYLQEFVEEYQRRMQFLCDDLGFGKPIVFTTVLIADLVYPQQNFALVFGYEARDKYVDCNFFGINLHDIYKASHWDDFSSLCRNAPAISLLRVLEALGVWHQVPYKERKRNRFYEQISSDKNIGKLYRSFDIATARYHKALLGRPPSDYNPKEMVLVQADLHEYLLRQYGKQVLAYVQERFCGKTPDAFERRPLHPRPIGLIENAQPHHALDCPTFHQLVEHYFAFLHQHGFERRPDLDDPNPPTCTCVFAGQHIGIMVYLSQPAPDWWHASGHPRTANIYVGVNVVRLRDYRQRDLGRYLVGLEGLAQDVPVPASASPVEREVARWAELLKRYGQRLLADREDSWEVG